MVEDFGFGQKRQRCSVGLVADVAAAAAAVAEGLNLVDQHGQVLVA